MQIMVNKISVNTPEIIYCSIANVCLNSLGII